MIFIPILLIAAVGFAVWSLLHHRHPVAASAVGPTDVVHHRQHMPTTPLGWVGLATAVLAILNAALVNVVQVPYLNIGIVVAAALSTLLARFVQHDRSTVVLAILVMSALSLLGSVLFLGGEIFIGHD